MNERDVIQLIQDDARMMHILHVVYELQLPDWCVCAGFVRTKVWDHIHGFENTPLSDVDVVYFDATRTDESIEKHFEGILRTKDDSVPWSVKNQARMHFKNGHTPYTSTVDALAHFPEVCTAVGVYLTSEGLVKLLAPYGVDDLVNLVVRPTPFFLSEITHVTFEHRVSSKRWSARWNQLRIMHP